MLKLIQNLSLCFLFISSASMAETRSRTVTHPPAIDAGASHAMYSEAMAYLLGKNGKTASPEKAFERLDKLANKGWTAAQYMLANMYSRGQGVTMDKARAYLWYSIAAKQNFSIAESKAAALKPHIQEEQLRKIELIVSEWKN